MAGVEADSHPLGQLQNTAQSLGLHLADKKFAQHMDSIDPLRHLRDEFHIPRMKHLIGVDTSLVDPEEDCVYFAGNSLGLCPKKTKQYMDIQLEKWAELGIMGHLNGELPWALCDECLDEDIAKLVGAEKGEVAIMNGLTINLHLLLISFYRPTRQRHKVLLEDHAFPSDYYAIESQIRLHGYDPETSIICMKPRQGEHILRREDILEMIEKEGESIVIICFSGLQYYTGQLFDMEAITKAGQAKGCYVGFDLAHAIGNVEVFLHDWNVDFACWCSYKYVNASAGGLAGLFLHERYKNNNFPKLLGWWGHNMDTRFVMDNCMQQSPGAYGYRVSNPPGLLCPPLKASLEIFKKTNLKELRCKSKLLTGYIEALLKQTFMPGVNSSTPSITVITPEDPEQRGAQLSLMFSTDVQVIFKEIMKRGIMCDIRRPNVVRIAPAPLYCSFEDAYRFICYLKEAITAASSS